MIPNFTFERFDNVTYCCFGVSSCFQNLLGPCQTSNFTWVELNANEIKEKTFVIYIEFDSDMKSQSFDSGLRCYIHFSWEMWSLKKNVFSSL